MYNEEVKKVILRIIESLNEGTILVNAADIKILIRTIIEQDKEINQLRNICDDESIASMILSSGRW